MAWNDLLANQMISFTDAQGGGFTLKSGQSSVTSNQCMDKTAALAKYNLNTTSMLSYSALQLVPKSAWVSAGFSGQLTVGGTSTINGYRNGLYGAMSSTNISDPAGTSAVLNDLYWSNGTLAIGITNGSTTIAPNGWTTLKIGTPTYNRSSFTFSYNGPTNKWLYTLAVATNPFGTVIGSLYLIQFT